MNTYSFADPVTGDINPMHLTCTNDVDLKANTPPGALVLPGKWPRSQYRFDVATSTVVPATPPVDPVALANAMRTRRDAALTLTDWTQATDSPLAPQLIGQWKAYRAALRNVPQQPGFPTTIVWPTAPDGTSAAIPPAPPSTLVPVRVTPVITSAPPPALPPDPVTVAA